MSEDEKRKIRAEALFEFEEAKASLALLRAKAESWYRLHQNVSSALARMKRDSAHLEHAAGEARAAILRNEGELRKVMDVDAVLALDGELETAVARMKRAAQTKQDLGFEI